jgi:hypothetical protein
MEESMNDLKPCPFINAMQDIHDYLLEGVKPWDVAHRMIYNIIEPLLKDADGACVNTRATAEGEIDVIVKILMEWRDWQGLFSIDKIMIEQLADKIISRNAALSSKPAEKQKGKCPYIVVEKFTDNGNHSHWELTGKDCGCILWSEEDDTAPAVAKAEGVALRKCDGSNCDDGWLLDGSYCPQREGVALRLIDEYEDSHRKVDGTSDYSLLRKWLKSRGETLTEGGQNEN